MAELSWLEDYGDSMYKGFDMSALAIDEAYLHVNLEETSNIYRIYRKHTECVNCPYVKLEQLSPTSILIDHLKIILQQVPRNLYRISTGDVDLLKPSAKYHCEFGTEFGQFGIYELNVTNTGCDITTVKKPVSIAFPVLTAALIYVALCLCVVGFIKAWERFVAPTEKQDKNAAGKKRVRSLDTFRGISIVVMIFVNYGAGRYDILDHAHWNGLHLADLVFPWFMWIMGACIPISLLSSFKKQISDKEIFFTVFKRSVKLFCLGIFTGAGSYLECMRIFGVLQRFGICYFVVTTICLLLMKREQTKSEHKIGKFFGDIVSLLRGWMAILTILTVYFLLLFLLADEGCPRGYLGPGGLHDDGKYFNCTGGATGYVDKTILRKHMFPYPTTKEIYLGKQSFDPEGILGCLPSIVHVFIGVQAGMILLIYKEHSSRLIRWFSWSILTGVIGGGLCGFSKENGFIPVNKNLWSISFALVTSCFAFLLLAICYMLIDVKNWWSGKPFLFAGMNAIIMYVGHDITYGHLPMRWTVYCGKDHGTHLIALIENLWGTGFWILLAWYLYKIKYFYAL